MPCSGISSHKPPAAMTHRNTAALQALTHNSTLIPAQTGRHSISAVMGKDKCGTKCTHCTCIKNAKSMLSVCWRHFLKVCRWNLECVRMCTLSPNRCTTTQEEFMECFCLLQAAESLVSLGEQASWLLTLSLSQSIHLQAQWYRVNAGHQWNAAALWCINKVAATWRGTRRTSGRTARLFNVRLN